ncbi:hypothetical protein ACX3VT_05390 [Aerococcus sanguinicola]|uniref:hypothetical protein n=1 Tax=unclassified Aerococcus TaxID=2618060 RepID=UPI0008A13348|nr:MULTISPECIES: hypothetical protein [unclassified Aerococcus]KAB0645770.1 hypothetical protein F6I01_09920 [Aerococcus sanguinicola]MDK6234316.1 hypothetical protein [Aerococcus sp. UMB10185]MDK6856420.1 hypothetical protein [Aerococcus sp. UMB7533]OFN01283.1 hypothetical protein HMPREF2626_07950 [Aerococcus sp. HMSC062A02]OHO44410.1 hypothetical protein HMPREF2705_06935 [Aerococcus sp. HMSC035B07]
MPRSSLKYVFWCLVIDTLLNGILEYFWSPALLEAFSSIPGNIAFLIVLYYWWEGRKKED